MLTVYQGNPIRDSLSAILTTPGSSPIGNLGHLFRPQIQEKLQQISSLDAFDFNLKVDAGEKYAEKAQQHYVDRINRHDENTPWHEKAADWAGGTLSSLWTCENSDKTLAVLGTALGAGRSTGASGLDDAARGLRNSSDDVQRAARNTNKVPQPKACFVAGTEIETPDGEKNIEDIKVGDLVIADDPTTPGEIESKRVEETFVRHTDALVDLYVDGEVISATNEHPFWVVGEGWVEAGDLKVGDELQTDEEKILDVDRIEKREGEFEVYNFKVEDFHTYFVSDLEILVHNACSDFGEAREAFGGIKDFEQVDGKTIVNPNLQVITPGTSAAPLQTGQRYIWVVDETGNLRIGTEVEVNPGQRLGHPTLVDGGKARVGGEIKVNAETNEWRINDSSGRYSRGRSKEERRQILDNVQQLFTQAGLNVGVKY